MAAIRRDAAAWERESRSRCDLDLGDLARRHAIECFRNCCDVLRRVSAAASGDVDQTATREVAQIARHIGWPKIEPGWSERIRQTCIRVARDGHVRLLR